VEIHWSIIQFNETVFIMNPLKLIFRSISFYKKEHLLLLIGIVLSTAIITASLIIGDSVKRSLQTIVNQRLGNTKQIIIAQERFFSASLSHKIAKELKTQTTPILLMRAVASSDKTEERIPNLQICGIESSFWKMAYAKLPELGDDDVIINKKTAQKLQLKIGDEVLLRIEKVRFVTGNAPFVPNENNSSTLRLTVKAIADEHSFGNFSLQSNQITPYSVFVSLPKLSRLNLKGDYANAILIGENALKINDINGITINLWGVSPIKQKVFPI